MRRVLAQAEGFVDTADQDRFDECESAMTTVLRDVRSVAFQWKVRSDCLSREVLRD